MSTDNTTATSLDATHDATLRSWVSSANVAGGDFPIQNLPLARLRRRGTQQAWRIGVAIGDQALDLALAEQARGWSSAERVWLAPLAQGDLNRFMAMGAAARRGLRLALSRALAAGSAQHAELKGALVAQADLEFDLPCRVGDYTDFYTGIHHATSVGKLFRPDQPLLPNYQWVPIGYHGRASSLQVSGVDFARPLGQTRAPDAVAPSFGPTQRLDYELELGVFVGAGNPDGRPMTMAQAEADWFGLVLLNDWSARDIQAWEYQPLGPFLSKSFATSLSPWLVTQEALAPFRLAYTRPEGDPQPLPHLDSPANRRAGAVDLRLEVSLQTAAMRAAGLAPERLSLGGFAEGAYWTIAQMLAHHSSNGCNLQPGDLLGTGTLSGPLHEQAGSLLELSRGGKQAISLANGETRTFLQDGDQVVFRAWAEAEGAVRIGLGSCSGTVLPALT
ncbi:MAG: fumarylacetoacetase [Burkholderiales bacterium]|nr:fumarylacetoacetase [Burkholderiales bacterium]